MFLHYVQTATKRMNIATISTHKIKSFALYLQEESLNCNPKFNIQLRIENIYIKKTSTKIYMYTPSDLMNNMYHMNISGTEPSSVILIQTK